MRPQLSHRSKNCALRSEIVDASDGGSNAVDVECVANRRMDGNKALSRFGSFETLHFSFASPERLMRVLSSIVGAQSTAKARFSRSWSSPNAPRLRRCAAAETPSTSGLRSDGNRHRQTQILRSGASHNWLLWTTRAKTARQQSS